VDRTVSESGFQLLGRRSFGRQSENLSWASALGSTGVTMSVDGIDLMLSIMESHPTAAGLIFECAL
jgi:hypothetical protein